MILAGADPGFLGAVCFLRVESEATEARVLGVCDMPTVKKASGRRELLLHDLVADCLGILDGRRCGHLWIERVNAFAPAERRMGASAAFSFGECFMALKMLAACQGWPFTLVGPAQWKKTFSLGSDKGQARARASELMPDDRHLWTPKRGVVNTEQASGRAEAALICLHGVRGFRSIEHDLLLTAAQ